MVRLLIVDDHRAVRSALAALLDAYEGIDVVAEASNGSDAVQVCATLEPDVVLMDIRMPGMDGVAATRAIKAMRPATGVVLMTAYEQDDLATAGSQAGAHDLIFKGVLGSTIADRVKEAAACA